MIICAAAADQDRLVLLLLLGLTLALLHDGIDLVQRLRLGLRTRLASLRCSASALCNGTNESGISASCGCWSCSIAHHVIIIIITSSQIIVVMILRCGRGLAGQLTQLTHATHCDGLNLVRLYGIQFLDQMWHH